ncbi:hypothetical protein BD309DRAFT_257892 [Dichomitus squalens]|nr:hypothetical protein BD309DRAFT_257892 [Dichomitus squalens]
MQSLEHGLPQAGIIWHSLALIYHGWRNTFCIERGLSILPMAETALVRNVLLICSIISIFSASISPPHTAFLD